MTFFRRQPQPKSQSVFELLMKGSIPVAAMSACRPEPYAALRRYLDAQRARETQAALADQFAGEYARALEGANSQERHAAAIIVAEAYEEARSLTQIELDLMVAAKVIRVSGRTEECKMGIQGSSEGDEMFGLAGHYVQAAAHWRNVAESEQVSICGTPGATSGRADGVQPRQTTTADRATSSTPSLKKVVAERAGRRGLWA